MLSSIEDQLLDDVVTRAEQSRVSYNTHTEEFRHLNANLETYLGDIRIIDNENHQLHDGIEQLRSNYILTLENHLKRLPGDFREQSRTLTEAHIERYKNKSRARRFITERDEFKKRIGFITSNEKEQIKRLNILQKQERTVKNEFNKLQEQIQNLLNYVESEKQAHRQAMERVDTLQVQLEQACVDRSRTEFEIQTLKEEVKLMQTAKEFLDEEREAILATQIEANEYLLSRLNESIARIREDFDELNRTQIKQFENEYKQMMQIIEENLTLTNVDDHDEGTITRLRSVQFEREQLRDEHQSTLQELATLTDHNQALTERVLAMESDLHFMQDERMRQLSSRESELERSKIELQVLSEQLNNLAEYDRNLKFELTLYRGVLESEYRRKQQQQQQQSQILVRPTTLRTRNNTSAVNTERTTWLSSSPTSTRSEEKTAASVGQEEVLTNRNRVESSYDTLGEIEEVQLDKSRSNEEKVEKQDIQQEASLLQERPPQMATGTFEIDQQQEKAATDAAFSKVQQTPSDIQKSPTASSADEQISSDTRKSSVSLSATNLAAVSSESRQSLTGAAEERTSPTTPPADRQAPLGDRSSPTSLITTSFSENRRQSAAASPPGGQTPSDAQKSLTESAEGRSSPLTLSTGQQTPPKVRRSPSSPTATTFSGDQSATEVQQSPTFPVASEQTPSDVRKSPITTPEKPSTPTEVSKSPIVASEDQTTTAEIQQSPTISPTDRPTPSEVQHSPSSPTFSGDRSATFRATGRQTPPDAQKSATTTPEKPSTPTEAPQSPTASPKDWTTLTEVQQPAGLSSEDRQTPSEAQQPLGSSTASTPGDRSRTFPSSGGQTPPKAEKSPITTPEKPSTPTEVPQTPIAASGDQTTTAEIQQPADISPEGRQTPSEAQHSPTSPTFSGDRSATFPATGGRTPPDVEKSPTTTPEKPSTPTEVPQSPTASPKDRTTVTEVQQPAGISPEGRQTPSEVQESSGSPTATTPEDRSATFPSSGGQTPPEARKSATTTPEKPSTPTEVQQWPGISPEGRTIPSDVEHSPSSPTFSGDRSATFPATGRQTPPDAQKSAATTSEKPSTPTEAPQSPTTSPKDWTTLTEVQQPVGISSEDRQTPSEAQQSLGSSTASTPGDRSRTFPSSGGQTPPEAEKSATTTPEKPSTPTEVPQTPIAASEDQTTTAEIQQPADISPEGRETPSEAQHSPTSPTFSGDRSATFPATGAGTPPDVEKSFSATPEKPSTPTEVQQSPGISPADQQTPSEVLASPTSSIISAFPADQHTSSQIEQSPSIPSGERQSPFEIPKSSTATTDDDARKQFSPFIIDEERATTSLAYEDNTKTSPTAPTSTDSPSTTTPVTRSSFSSVDENIRQDEGRKSVAEDTIRKQSRGDETIQPQDTERKTETSTSVSPTDDSSSRTQPESERRRSSQTIEPTFMEQFEVIVDTLIGRNRSESHRTSQGSAVERRSSTADSDTDAYRRLSSTKDTDTLHQIGSTGEEYEPSSSLQHKSEEDSKIGYVSSKNLDESNLQTVPDPAKLSSHDTSLIEVEGGVEPTSSPRLETSPGDDDEDGGDQHFQAVMQGLHLVFRELANDGELIEIHDDLPEKLIDRLEFRDHLIQTLFEGVLKKYIVQAAADLNRLGTIDWIEFRDIIFPIITGRYMERHVRKLFDLFDTSKDGYLSLQEIADLLELLQANNAMATAQNIIEEFDRDHDGKLTVDELVTAIKRIDDASNNLLSEQTENKTWWSTPPTNEDLPNQSISLPVPTSHSQLTTTVNPADDDDILYTTSSGILLLGRIFKKVGANTDSKQLDSHNGTLAERIATELETNNVPVSVIDLEQFIQLFLNTKQNSDPSISWIEFRDLLLPIVNGGMFTKNDIARWFAIFDTNKNGTITREQTLDLFRLLQIIEPEETLEKLNEITPAHANKNAPWTLEELTRALDNVDETAARLLSDSEHTQQTASFDIDWLAKHIF